MIGRLNDRGDVACCQVTLAQQSTPSVDIIIIIIIIIIIKL